MLSTTLELLGLATLALATLIAFGLAPALYVGGVALMFTGYAAGDVKPLAPLIAWAKARRKP